MKSFFEYLGIADAERIHSQFFAWVLSEDCLAIDSNQKKLLLKDVFNLPQLSSINAIYTEFRGIDILIKTDTAIIVIENKLKSTQHSNQLTKYQTVCKNQFPGIKPYYFYLSLLDEKNIDHPWQRISYETLYCNLKDLILTPSVTHTIIFNEYLIFLGKLTAVVNDFMVYPEMYDLVFTDGKKRKEDKIGITYKNDNEAFIAANQLETILQKVYFTSVVETTQHPLGFINDTRGDALIDFVIQQNISFDKRKYQTMIQLQGDIIKFSVVIQEGYASSDKAWIENLLHLMQSLALTNKLGYAKLNKPKSKAYISISRKLDIPFWHNSVKDLSIYLKKEIENGKALSEMLVKSMHNNT